MASRTRHLNASPRRLLIGAAALLALAGVITGAFALVRPGPSGAPALAHPVAASAVAQAQAGDLVFRLGKSLWSPYFGLLNSHSGFSHVGILVEASPGRLAVIHAEADDDGRNGWVKLTPLQQFIDDSTAFEIKRNRMPAAQKHGFVSSAIRHWLDATAFDDKFTLDDRGERLYCSELVWVASRAVAGDALGQIEVIAGREIISVDSIYRSPLLR